MGLGGNNTWSEKARPMPTYRLSAPSHTYGVTLRACAADRTAAEAASAPVPRAP